MINLRLLGSHKYVPAATKLRLCVKKTGIGILHILTLAALVVGRHGRNLNPRKAPTTNPIPIIVQNYNFIFVGNTCTYLPVSSRGRADVTWSAGHMPMSNAYVLAKSTYFTQKPNKLDQPWLTIVSIFLSFPPVLSSNQGILISSVEQKSLH